MEKYTYDQNGNAYRLRGSKHSCPSCGHSRTFQLYVNVITGEPINDQVGKCDRHHNCGYDNKPRDYFRDNPAELPTPKDGRRRYYSKESPKPLITIPEEYVVKSIIRKAEKGLSGFTDVLLQMFAPSDVKKVIDKYFLGRTHLGAVIFWQIDSKGRIREGKAMKYNVYTGGRDKASWSVGESFWVFSDLQARKVLPRPGTSTKCLFGEHLLQDANNETDIMIVESEKNAIFGALAFPDYTWLAVGSRDEFGKLWKIKDILTKCRSVVVVPDSDALAEWKKQAEKLQLPNAKVSNLCAGHAGGWDLADMIRDIYMQHPQQFNPTQRRETTSVPPTPPPPTAKVEATKPTIIYRLAPLIPEQPLNIIDCLSEAEFNVILSPSAVAEWQAAHPTAPF